MLKFIFTFVSVLVGFVVARIVFGDINTKHIFLEALIFSVIVNALYYLSRILEILSITPNKSQTGRGHKYKLISFNDAIADELIRIRIDLVSIKLKQDMLGWRDLINIKKIQDELACSNIPDDFLDKIPIDFLNNIPEYFLRLYGMYLDYPYNALCRYYKTPNGDRFGGKIIVILDQINFDGKEHPKFDAKKLRKINSQKTHKFVAGMNISVYIYEPELYKSSQIYLSYHDFEWEAKILSIKKDESYDPYNERLNITLEMGQLDYNGEHCGDKIIRTIEIVNDYPWHFIPDNAT